MTTWDPPIAPHRLRFLIVGGSIAGLACAYTLSKAGHEVTVFERRNGPSQSTATVRSPPHMTRVLKRWGLTEEWIAQKGAPSKRVVTQDATKDQLFQVCDVSHMLTEDLAPFLCPRHCDLHVWLIDLVKAQGVHIRYGTEVVHIDAQRPSVHLASGESWLGDIVVGADGYASRVREVVTGEELQFKSPRTVYSMVIPMRKVQSDPELAAAITEYDWNIWMDNDRCLQGYLDPVGQQFYFVAFAPTDSSLGMDARWETSVPLDALDIASSVSKPILRRLLQLADSVTPVPELRYEPLDSWVHEDNKVLLVGDAAAPYPLPGNYTISVAIEDASVLGALLGRVRANEQIPALLAAYDELRPARAADLARRDLHLLDGWQRLSLHQASPNADSDGVLDEDEAMLKRFEEYLHAVGYETFEAANYDCYEVAGDWLQQWPSLLQSSTTVLISPMVDVYRDVTVREHHDEGYYSEC